MNALEATITNAIDINTLGGGHLRLMPGQYRVTPDRQGGAELVRIDAQQPPSRIRLTAVQWGLAGPLRPRVTISAPSLTIMVNWAEYRHIADRAQDPERPMGDALGLQPSM